LSVGRAKSEKAGKKSVSKTCKRIKGKKGKKES
jgi:hypothetical protein